MLHRGFPFPHCPLPLRVPPPLQDEPAPVQPQHTPPHGYRGPPRTTGCRGGLDTQRTQITSWEMCPTEEIGQWPAVCD